MKELRGAAHALVPAPLASCLALVEAVDGYPVWYPEVVREVEVVERDARGLPTRVQTKLHLSVGPVTKDFDVLMAVTVEPPATVKLTKVGGSAKFDVIWRLSEGEKTRIEVQLDASLDVPRFLPLGDVGNSVAQGFVSAASTELARRPVR
jgi:ribosome-associated toxin RatA of RatAB toxin-antitoxin module